ncbi:uncharacterized protein VICG_00419 [Vittaforma corneae ATCC 50505]|uniref:Uncharacterized protein n=1 Tax=Vittaforma corneae (strain ATCC 50505) TaxID=993615 RepID=L2GQS9_VITCO|nr:uncharacterized protein VICG_00419 [Vittaforma corneae ATCC 50505]ELA42667.1 hypothetical protein VICG_00419 [Vittaforma corneae ATCC 50505]
MDMQPKRRTNLERRIDIPLAFQLVLLLRTRKEALYLCTRSSLALRIAILCELSVEHVLELRNGVVKVIKAPERNISKDFAHKISEISLNPRDLLEYLNGERGRLAGVENLRKKIYSEMQSKGLIRVSKGVIFNKIRIQNADIWQNIYEKIIYEVQNSRISKESIILLTCLNYVNTMESLLLQCNESTASLIVQQMSEIKKRIQNKQYAPEDSLMYQFLSFMII